ncbi:hypothetical protein [Qipengyuania sediminis]|uniref:hypothetical protein n=1 Tax=Qipengyuania sediminis TaxID=1532023 RepID=UPI0010599A66|nr:hypothetical protein [Qipengyuania sediminis]
MHSALDVPAGEEIAFLHRLDGVQGEAAIAVTDRGRLRASSFLDGRERFWRSQAVLPLQLNGQGAYPARRFIFHVGFCGSTLLARLIDHPGHVLVLKEPQCLADIAGQRAALVAGEGVAPIGALIDHALGSLGAVGEPELAIVVKPTNWVNSLLDDLCAPGRIDHALFVSMDIRAYLGAVFRGGRDRLAFCTRLAGEIAPALAGGPALLAKAAGSEGDPLDRAARIVALLHAMQETLFDRAIAANAWPSAVRIDFAHLTQHPAAVLRRARRLLGLGVGGEDDERAFALMSRHTKDPASPFEPSERLRQDREIEQHHAARFDAALEWLETTGPLAT